MITISYWSDYACPYCYIGEARLKQAIKELGVEDQVRLEMRAYQLDPYAPDKADGDTVSRFAVKYRLSKTEAAKRVNDISLLGRRVGLEFNYATTLFTNTMDAHRLTKWVGAKGDYSKTQEVIDALFHAYFAENLELANHEVLISVAEKCGIDREEVKKLLLSNDFEKEVREDEREASERGVRGVPYFLFSRLAIPGALSVGDFKKVLSETIEDFKKESPVKGHTCGPEGCMI